MIVVILVMLVGAVSALMYALSRKWLDALLALVAAGALTLLLGEHAEPGQGQLRAHALIDPAGAPADIGDVAQLSVKGDGMRAARWLDLPARALDWRAPAGDVLRLDFPRRIARGSLFTLSVTRAPASGWRVQLLAENGLLLAQSNGQGATQSLSWTPPAAERMVLTARIIDGRGAVLAQGPVPLLAVEPPPLRVRGRFSAASFDLHALHELLAASGALLDWQVELGKGGPREGVLHTELPRSAFARPDLLVTDADWLEQHPELLKEAEAGAVLLVLRAAVDAEDLDAAYKLVAEGMAVRTLGQGRLVRLAASDWHRMAISDPRAHSLWWQQVFDRAGVHQGAAVEWIDTEALPLPHERLEVCARGASTDALFPQLHQQVPWQRRPDQVDAACVGVWPARTGWLEVQTTGPEPLRHSVYVYANTDWPLWQKALLQDATRAYAARSPGQPVPRPRALPAWPFAAVFTLAMLLLWWRERR